MAMILHRIDHPNYNFDLEILAMLPRYPTYVEAHEIESDLGSAMAGGIRLAIDRLRRRGIAIHGKNINRLRAYSVMPESWAMAQVIAENYMKEVYVEG